MPPSNSIPSCNIKSDNTLLYSTASSAREIYAIKFTIGCKKEENQISHSFIIPYDPSHEMDQCCHDMLKMCEFVCTKISDYHFTHVGVVNGEWIQENVKKETMNQFTVLDKVPLIGFQALLYYYMCAYFTECETAIPNHNQWSHLFLKSEKIKLKDFLFKDHWLFKFDGFYDFCFPFTRHVWILIKKTLPN